jgi:hypothetical protein
MTDRPVIFGYDASTRALWLMYDCSGHFEEFCATMLIATSHSETALLGSKCRFQRRVMGLRRIKTSDRFGFWFLGK